MGGPRIVVLQLKQLLKSAAFAVVGILLIILLIYFLVPKNKATRENLSEAAVYIPGTYAAQIILHNYPVDVTVTVNQNEIVDVGLSDMPPSEEMFYPLFKPVMAQLRDEILKKQSLKSFVPPLETEVTSRILIDAVSAALKQAKTVQ